MVISHTKVLSQNIIVQNCPNNSANTAVQTSGRLHYEKKKKEKKKKKKKPLPMRLPPGEHSTPRSLWQAMPVDTPVLQVKMTRLPIITVNQDFLE